MQRKNAFLLKYTQTSGRYTKKTDVITLYDTQNYTAEAIGHISSLNHLVGLRVNYGCK